MSQIDDHLDICHESNTDYLFIKYIKAHNSFILTTWVNRESVTQEGVWEH